MSPHPDDPPTPSCNEMHISPNADDPPTPDHSEILMSPNPDGPPTPNCSEITMSPNLNPPPPQSAPSLPPEITHVFHSTINGMLFSSSFNIYYLKLFQKFLVMNTENPYLLECLHLVEILMMV